MSEQLSFVTQQHRSPGCLLPLARNYVTGKQLKQKKNYSRNENVTKKTLRYAIKTRAYRLPQIFVTSYAHMSVSILRNIYDEMHKAFSHIYSIFIFL